MSEQPYFDSRSLLNMGMPQHTVEALKEAFNRTGSSTDVAIDLSDLQALVLGFLSQKTNKKVKTEFQSISSDYTTKKNEVLKVTASLTITLNADPKNNESVTVYHSAGTGAIVYVTDGTGTDQIMIDQSVLSYTYSSELSQWIRGL